jgi:hypothetical protein
MRGSGVAAAVTEAGDVTDEDLIRPQDMTVSAARRWFGDPLPGRWSAALGHVGRDRTVADR